MSHEATETAILEALKILASPEGDTILTVTDVDDKLVVQLSALKTLATVANDDVLNQFVTNLAMLARSRKRRGSKEIVEILKGARARVLQTTVLSGVKRVMVGRSGLEEIE